VNEVKNGRPFKSDSRSRQVQVRFSPNEYLLLEKKAKKTKTGTIAEYIRDLFFKDLSKRK